MNTPVYRFDLLDVPGAHNVRDIGGYRGLGGAPVRKRRFLRAGGMHGLTPAGVHAVRELGVGCIVDLRSTFEARRMPDTLREDGAVAYVHVPMLDYIQSSFASGDIDTFPASMAEMYVGLLDSGGEEFRRVFQVFSDDDHPVVLYHCTAGKDRTGLTTMLLLGLAGVSREDIIYDYAQSERLVPPVNAAPSVPRYLFASEPATMEAALDHVDKNYGGIPAYLDHIGVDEGMRRRVLKKLL